MSRKKKPLMKSTKQVPKRIRIKHWRLLAGIAAFGTLLFVILGSTQFGYKKPTSLDQSLSSSLSSTNSPKLFDFEIIRTYKHDSNAFTQGLQYDLDCNDDSTICSDIFWESTGLYGESTVRKVNVPSGEVLVQTHLSRKFFGEGLTRLGGSIYQLTWLTPTVFIYNLNLSQIRQAKHPLEDGWGLTTDGHDLILTDSGSVLYWIDPLSFNITKKVPVEYKGHNVKLLNELEWIEGLVWANIWQKNCIAQIRPDNGKVVGWVMLEALTREAAHAQRKSTGHRRIDVLNGIAYDKWNKRLFLTGKLWGTMYEIKLKEIKNPSQEQLDQVWKLCIP